MSDGMGQTRFYPDTEMFSYIITETCSGIRLDHYLVQTIGDGVSRSQIVSSIKSAAVKVNGSIVKAGYRLKNRDLVAGFIAVPEIGGRPEPQSVEFGVLYEDDSIVVINKPPGLVVHPGSGNRDHTLVNGLVYRYGDMAEVGDEERPGIVHRLDKDTSGIMVVARTGVALRKLAQEFKDRNISKRYLALVNGIPDESSGRIVAPIGRHSVNRQKMTVRHHNGRYAATNWEIRHWYDRHAFAEVEIETGRTHQIRVHMAHIGYPVAGDKVYGAHRHNDDFPRQMLHAWRLCFRHPVTGEEMEMEAPIAQDIKEALDRLENSSC